MRITISLEKEVEEKIKQLQDELVKKAGKAWSISKTINVLLIGGILSQKSLHIRDWTTIKNYSDGKPIDLSDETIEEYVPYLSALEKMV